MTQIPREIHAEILRRLEAVEKRHGVRILFAVESGSRAWGFASTDSDFDVRFVHVHQLDWYLSIDERRDVIELPIEGVYDINGWDLRKTLQLLIKPNPVLLEWLGSPVVYRADETAFASLKELAERTAHQRPSQYHYLHLGQSQYRRHIAGKGEIKLKKYFYVLRPALVLQWLRHRPQEQVPVDFRQLMNGLELPKEVIEATENLLARKMAATESGLIAALPVLDVFMENEFALSSQAITRPAPPKQNLVREANELFRALVRAKM